MARENLLTWAIVNKNNNITLFLVINYVLGTSNDTTTQKENLYVKNNTFLGKNAEVYFELWTC